MQNLSFNDLPEAIQKLSLKLDNIEGLIKVKLSEAPEAQEKDELLTIKEAATFLDLAVPTLYSYVQKQKIPVCKKANRLYFPKAELIEWVKSGRQKTVTEIKRNAMSNTSKPKQEVFDMSFDIPQPEQEVFDFGEPKKKG